MKNTIITTLSIAALLGLSACSTGGAATGEASTPASAPASKGAAPAPAPAPAKTEEPAATSGTAKFGQVWKYNDGVSITVSKPAPGVGTDSSTAAGKPISIYTVTIVNGAKEPLKPTAYANVSHGPEGVTAEQVFDSAQGLGMGFSNTILPGKRATVKLGFALPATAKDVTFSIAPDFGHSDALFVD